MSDIRFDVQPHGVEPPPAKTRASRLEAAIDLAKRNEGQWVTFCRDTQMKANNDARTLRTMGLDAVVRDCVVWARAK